MFLGTKSPWTSTMPDEEALDRILDHLLAGRDASGPRTDTKGRAGSGPNRGWATKRRAAAGSSRVQLWIARSSVPAWRARSRINAAGQELGLPQQGLRQAPAPCQKASASSSLKVSVGTQPAGRRSWGAARSRRARSIARRTSANHSSFTRRRGRDCLTTPARPPEDQPRITFERPPLSSRTSTCSCSSPTRARPLQVIRKRVRRKFDRQGRGAG